MIYAGVLAKAEPGHGQGAPTRLYTWRESYPTSRVKLITSMLKLTYTMKVRSSNPSTHRGLQYNLLSSSYPGDVARVKQVTTSIVGVAQLADAVGMLTYTRLIMETGRPVNERVHLFSDS